MNMKFNKIMMAGLALCAGLAFTSCQNEPLDPNPMAGSDVKIASFGPSMLQRMDTMQIFGVKLDKASKVIFQAAEVERAAFTYASAEEIDVVIPDDARPGKIGLLVGSDTVWSKTPMVFSEPISIDAITPAEGIVPGTQITVKGDYVYNIASVTFEVGQLVNAVDFVKCERHELVINVPMGAVAGTAVFTDGADWVEKIDLDIVGATYESISATSTDFGQELTITGTYLQLVDKITFSGNVAVNDFVLASDNNSIKVNVPADATPGVITLTQFSLVSLYTDSISLPVIEVTDINPKEDIHVGDEITITGSTLNYVKSVMVGGDVVVSDFTVSADGTTITFLAPEGMKNGRVKLTENANISVETAGVKIYKEPAPEEELAVGPIVATGWANQPTILTAGELDGQAGKILRLYVTVEDGWCLQLFDAWWAGQLCGEFKSETYDLASNDNIIEIVLTEEFCSMVTSHNGMVLNGDKVTVDRVTLMSAEQLLAMGPIVATGWANQPTILNAGELDESALGKTLLLYVTVEEGWCLQLFDTWWAGQLCGEFKAETYDLEAHEGAIELVLTDSILNEILTKGGIVLNGDKVTVDKIALK